MKYLVAAVMCTLVGAFIMQVDADGFCSIRGDTYKEGQVIEYLLDVTIFAHCYETSEIFEGNTASHPSRHYYKANMHGSTDPDSWHFYIDWGYYYKTRGRKEEGGGVWTSPLSPEDWVKYPNGGVVNLYHTFEGSK